ncbi:carbohydrate ABC transporter permease [Streptomyces castrisilvae]|uniref:Carbohydrate ABC transporter permease n=1 Tax=Streptomyces castrisilvae TaxID=3033811 RepID=A0ABY9HKW4_9ACTN|nr:carbohydrate ABC transporter permease [Streptomyces sp. Mut1]WLQ35195.1 carbohydrate ABC transporter permease [Streptomyces sp. Mut1]
MTVTDTPATPADSGPEPPTAAPPRPRRRSGHDDPRGTKIGFAAMCLVSLAMMTPFLWAGLTALKPFVDAFRNPPVWTFTPQLDTFRELWQSTVFAETLLNTTLVAACSVVVSLLVGAPAAYAFARYRGRIGPALLVLALVFRALPRFAVVLPFYEASRAIGVYDTNLALVVAFTAVNMPFTVLLLTGFFRELPEELDEAAMVDGCTPLQTFRRVILPLTGPGLVTAGLFAFLLAFQEYLVALTLTQNDAVTIPVFVAAQSGADDIMAFQVLAACSLALAVPIILITIFARRYFVAGLTGGALKG